MVISFLLHQPGKDQEENGRERHKARITPPDDLGDMHICLLIGLWKKTLGLRRRTVSLYYPMRFVLLPCDSANLGSPLRLGPTNRERNLDGADWTGDLAGSAQAAALAAIEQGIVGAVDQELGWTDEQACPATGAQVLAKLG
jgi:hypothetical protein